MIYALLRLGAAVRQERERIRMRVDLEVFNSFDLNITTRDSECVIV